jgi:two-component system sensor histidine kinase RegB
VWDTAAIRRGHLRIRTLVNVRWMVIVGQIVLLAAMGLGLGYHAPYAACAVVIAAGAAVNLLTIFLRGPLQRVLDDGEAVIQLCLDIAQLGALMAFIGGTANPFVLVMIAPVTLAAATLPLRPCCWSAAWPRWSRWCWRWCRRPIRRCGRNRSFRSSSGSSPGSPTSPASR